MEPSLPMDSFIVFGAKYLFAAVVLGAAIPLISQSRESRARYLTAAAFALVLGVAMTKGAGAMYFDPRPFTHGVKALIAHEPDNGFPSDHTVLSFAAAVLALWANRRLGAGLLLVAAVVGACRTLSGVHTPLDVVAGAAIGVVSAACSILLALRVVKASSGSARDPSSASG